MYSTLKKSAFGIFAFSFLLGTASFAQSKTTESAAYIYVEPTEEIEEEAVTATVTESVEKYTPAKVTPRLQKNTENSMLDELANNQDVATLQRTARKGVKLKEAVENIKQQDRQGVEDAKMGSYMRIGLILCIIGLIFLIIPDTSIIGVILLVVGLVLILLELL